MDLDPVLVFLKPFFHPFCVMDSQVVDDEEVFPFLVLIKWRIELFKRWAGCRTTGVLPLGAKLRRTWASGFAAVSSAYPISASSAFARAFRLG